MTTTAKKLLGEAQDKGALDIDGFQAWLDEQGWRWQPLARGEYGITLEQAQMAYISTDPVLWCQAFMDEPDTGRPYTFWDYQQVSVRSWRQDVIHRDAAEVGKTREITALILWGMCTAFGGSIVRPSILVAAPQQTHLDEIIMDIEEHVGVAEDAGKHKPFLNHFWLKPKRTPHTMFRFATPNPVDPARPKMGRVYFRPAGHDGEAFRGVHVNALGLCDEAAKIKNPVIWSEFHRALKPGCRRRIYSVHDGDRSTEFHRMTEAAVPGLAEGQPGLRLFHWPKTLMPAPFWSDERRQHFIEFYGGEDSPGYLRNVLGLPGQQENPVFPWATLSPNLRDVPEYRCIKLLQNKSEGTLHVIASRIDCRQVEGKTIGELVHLADRYDALGDFKSKDPALRRTAIWELLREWVEPAGPGVYWCGGDLGYAKDPTELFVFRELGPELRLVLRVSAKGVDYDQQCDLIDAIDELYGRQAGWGVDFGNAGTMVVQSLQNREEYADGHYEDRMTGFLFGAAVDAIDEDGNPVEAEDRKTGDLKPVRLPAKQLATDLMLQRMQRRGYALPRDPEVVQHLSDHTAREGARHLIFSKNFDHTIDAARTAMLRKAFSEGGGVDVFASGVQLRGVA